MLVRVRLSLRSQSVNRCDQLANLPPILEQALHHQTSNPPKTLKMAATPSNSKRPTCPSCSKPCSLCICVRIRTPGIQSKVSVAILQHSLEKKHPLNSGRIAKLGLSNVTMNTVSDVTFDARFVIRLLGPCLSLSAGPDGFENSDFDQVLEMKDTQKQNFDDRENMTNRGNKGVILDAKNETISNDILNETVLDVNNVFQGSAGAVITATMEKSGSIVDIDNVWIPGIHGRKRQSFDQILASEAAVDALGKGFVVKRWQKRQLNGSVELEELEIVVPPGSVLLFPSEKAVGVGELERLKIEVKNLIVLDGTWAKARRMYNENPWLRLLPHLKLDLDKLSLYNEVRHQPKSGYLSTIESIVYALKALGENPEGLDNLLDVFESMVGDQRRRKDERLSKLSPI